MKKWIIIVTGILPMLAFAQQNKFILDGKLLSDSAIHGYIYFNYHNKGNLATDIKDSALISDNHYHLEGSMTDGAVRLVINWARRPMNVDTGRNQLRSMAIFISAGDHAYVQHRANFHDIQVQGSLMQSEADSIGHVFSLRQRPPDKIIEDFIRQHPSSWLSYLLLDDASRHHMISPATSAGLYAVLDPELKKYEYVRKMGTNIAMYAGESDKDMQAKDFTLHDTNGQSVTLSSFRGKYVLLDFWASWCGPCRAENPNLTKAYNTYKDKQFTILSVSMDQSKQAWLDAVKKDGLDWTQASDLKGMTGPVAGLYSVSAIPANFLIDPSGKIIATNLRGPELEQKLAGIFGAGPAQGKKFVIDGKIIADTVSAGKIYLSYNDNGEEMRDSSAIVNNTYHFEGQMQDGAIQVNLFWKDKPKGIRFKGFVQFYAQPGNVTLVHKGGFNKVEITGSPVQQDAELVKGQTRLKGLPENEAEINFIKSHPNSWLSFVFLESRFIRGGDIGVDEADSLYTSLSPELKKHSRVSYLKKLIDGRRSAVVGKPAIPFTERDADGKIISLSAYRGKYVLIDFWASWCHPCRAENPNVTAAYHKFKDKGFNVLSISLDADREHWLKAVQQDKLEWTQVSNLKGFDDEAAVKYGIHAIPQNFLIDPAGNIVAQGLRGVELDRKLSEIFN